MSAYDPYLWTKILYPSVVQLVSQLTSLDKQTITPIYSFVPILSKAAN